MACDRSRDEGGAAFLEKGDGAFIAALNASLLSPRGNDCAVHRRGWEGRHGAFQQAGATAKTNAN
jgi:hypothetical protein